MSGVPLEPCGDEDCDNCYPGNRYYVQTDSVRRVRHRLLIKATSPEAALAEYHRLNSADGPSHPTSYDEHDLAVLEISPTVAVPLDDHLVELYSRGSMERCRNNPEFIARMEKFLKESPDNPGDDYVAPGFEESERERPETD